MFLCQNEALCPLRIFFYKNVFRLQIYFHANQTYFHTKYFERRLFLKQRHKVSRKWPINGDAMDDLLNVTKWYFIQVFLSSVSTFSTSFGVKLPSS